VLWLLETCNVLRVIAASVMSDTEGDFSRLCFVLGSGFYV
jgi:hypothetical protein